MSYSVYKLIHLAGLLALFFSIGALWSQLLLNKILKKSIFIKIMIVHGVASLASLLGGFGLAAKLGFHSSWPHWLTAKFIILLILISSVSFFKRVPNSIRSGILACFLLGLFAIYLAQYKPFV